MLNPRHGLGAITIAGDGKARLASFCPQLCVHPEPDWSWSSWDWGQSDWSQSGLLLSFVSFSRSLSLSMIYHALPYHLAGDKVIEIDSSESPERKPPRGQFEKCCFSRVNHFCAIAGTDARKGSRNFLSPTPKWSPGGWDSFSVLLFVLLLISPLAGKDGSDPKGEKGGWDSFSVLPFVLLLNHLLQEPKDPTRRGNREAGVLIVLCCGRDQNACRKRFQRIRAEGEREAGVLFVLCCGRYQNACRKRFQRIRAEWGKGRLGFCLCCAVAGIHNTMPQDMRSGPSRMMKAGVC